MVEYTGNELLSYTARHYHRRRWLNLAAMNPDDFRYSIYDKAGQAAGNIHDNDAGMTVVFVIYQPEALAHGDDWNHLAAQIDDTLDIRRHVGHLSYGRHTDDFPHLEHLDTIFFIRQHETDELDQFLVLCCII